MELGNPNKKYLGLSLTTWAIIAAVIILLICKTHETFSNSIEYSNTEISTNETTVINQTINVYNFNTTWCGWSRKFAPVWDNLASAYENDDSVKCHDVKCDNPDEKTANLLSQFDIQGYPSVVIVQGEKVIEYQGERSVKAISAVIDDLKKSQ